MMADVKSDYVKTIHRKLSATSGKLLAAECAELSARAKRWLGEEAPAVSESTIAHSADLRYVGQAFQIEVAIDPAWLEEPGTDRLRAAFHDRHERLYAHADRAADVELIDLRATITGATPKPELRRCRPDAVPATPGGRRPIHYESSRYDAAVYHRAICSPASTSMARPSSNRKIRHPGARGFRASVDAFGQPRDRRR